MTEHEWLTETNVKALIDFLVKSQDRSERKLRLFAVACCRRIESLMDEPTRRIIEVAERFADGLVGPEELAQACQSIKPSSVVMFAAWFSAVEDVDGAARRVPVLAVDAIRRNQTADVTAERDYQCAILRDIFGNPFRPHAAGRTGLHAGPARTLAEEIYQKKAFDRLPELAALLEPMEQPEPELLAHLQSPGPHVLGCWALDAILNKM